MSSSGQRRRHRRSTRAVCEAPRPQTSRAGVRTPSGSSDRVWRASGTAGSRSDGRGVRQEGFDEVLVYAADLALRQRVDANRVVAPCQGVRKLRHSVVPGGACKQKPAWPQPGSALLRITRRFYSEKRASLAPKGEDALGERSCARPAARLELASPSGDCRCRSSGVAWRCQETAQPAVMAPTRIGTTRSAASRYSAAKPTSGAHRSRPPVRCIAAYRGSCLACSKSAYAGQRPR